MASELGVRLRKLRKLRKMSQAELAEHLGWPLNTISKVENGGRRVTWEEGVRIAAILQVDLNALAGKAINDNECVAMRQKTTELRKRLEKVESELEKCEAVLAGASF